MGRSAHVIEAPARVNPAARARIASEALHEVASDDMISVIVPVDDTADSLLDLYREFSLPLSRTGRPFEFVFVVGPDRERLANSLQPVMHEGEPVRVIVAARQLSETALFRKGVECTTGETIMMLPAYRQVEANALPALLARLDEGADLAVARRWPRRDPWINRMQNRMLHSIIGRLGEHRLHDIACGARAMRREVLREVPLYGDYARFLPLLAHSSGFAVVEEPVAQHARNLAPRVYRPGIYVRRVIDVLGLFFLLRFIDKPLRFFGLLGGASALCGGVILFALLLTRLAGNAIGQRPIMLVGTVLFVLGIQIIALGLVGELIVHLSIPARRYRIRPPPA